jgi:hypothetical protein
MLISGYAIAADDIYVTPSSDWRPLDTGLPCVGIKPDGVTRTAVSTCGTSILSVARVEIVGNVELTPDGETALTGTTGLVELVDQLTALLEGNKLGVAAVSSAHVVEQSPSSRASDEYGTWMARMSLTIEYTMEAQS